MTKSYKGVCGGGGGRAGTYFPDEFITGSVTKTRYGVNMYICVCVCVCVCGVCVCACVRVWYATL